MYTEPLDQLPHFKTTGAPLAQQVLDFITEKVAPVGGLEMGDWGAQSECGTYGCFAGWTMMLTRSAHWREVDPEDHPAGAERELCGKPYASEAGWTQYGYVENVAGGLLGLDRKDQTYMFLWNRGPSRVLPELWRRAVVVWGDDITVPESVLNHPEWVSPSVPA